MLFLISVCYPIPTCAQTRNELRKEIIDLDREMQNLEKRQRSLTVRVAAMEELDLKWKARDFRFHALMGERDGLISSLVNIAANAYQYTIRPTNMGGGAGRYTGYVIPSKMTSDPNGTYSASLYPDSAVFVGLSARNHGTIRCTADLYGVTGGWVIIGDFE